MKLGKFILNGFSLSVLCSIHLYANQDNNATTLPTIVVTASGFAQDVRDAPASVTIISSEQLSKQPIRNIGDALSDVEGVQVNRGGKAGGSNIGIRGLDSSYTLILIDGKRLNRSGSVRPNGFGDVDSNFIPPASAIERIEVVRGPMSTLYGSDALGGVVNIITKKIPQEFEGQMDWYYMKPQSSDFGINSGLSMHLHGPIIENLLGVSFYGKLSHVQGARGTYIKNQTDLDNGTKSGRYGAFTGLGESDDYLFGTKFVYTPNDIHTLSLDLESSRQNFENSKGEVGTSRANGYDDRLIFTRYKISPSHKATYDNLIVETSFMYDFTDTRGRLNPKTSASSPVHHLDGLPRDLEYSNLLLDHTYSMGVGENHYLVFGGQYRHQFFVDTLAGADLDINEWQVALFGEDEWSINDSLIATLGIRYDHNENFGSHLSPRFYLIGIINDEWRLRGGISSAFKAPNINLLHDGIYGLGRQGTLPLLGNPDLKPETSVTYELGISYDDDKFSTSLTGFYTDFKDKIGSKYVDNCHVSPGVGCVDLGSGWGVPQFYMSENYDKVEIYGLEFSSTYKPRDDLKFKLNYTFTDSEILEGKSKGDPLRRVPAHVINARADWDINSMVSTWVDSRYAAREFNDRNWWDKKKSYYNDYIVFNMGVNVKTTKNFTLGFGVSNIFDKDFVDYGPRRTGLKPPTATENFVNSYDKIREGRSFWLNAKYTF